MNLNPLKTLGKGKRMSKFYQNWCIKKAKIKLHRLERYYKTPTTILEIGSGNGALGLLLKQSGHSVTALDIANKSVFDQLQPIVYDGGNFPFKDQSYEVAQLITMLHHCPDPIHLIKEAKRVAKRLIIMEDIYENRFQKYLTFAADSVNNWEFAGHPHTNKTDKEWQEVFDTLDLEIVSVVYHPFLLLFKQVTYELIPKNVG